MVSSLALAALFIVWTVFTGMFISSRNGVQARSLLHPRILVRRLEGGGVHDHNEIVALPRMRWTA